MQIVAIIAIDFLSVLTATNILITVYDAIVRLLLRILILWSAVSCWLLSLRSCEAIKSIINRTSVSKCLPCGIGGDFADRGLEFGVDRGDWV